VSKARAWSLCLDDARAAVDARSRFVEFLQRIQSNSDFIATAELIFGELLGNVVRHAPGPVEIAIDLNEASMILHVIDSGPLLRSARRRLPDDVLSERGRGLFIVEQLATKVQIKRRAGRGNHISVTMLRRL
jgi:anti-sigma regulatory factor (Ser/Thr protein kinase)